MDEGVIYIAYGDKAVKQAERFVRATKDWPVAVVSDREVPGAQTIIFEGDFWGTSLEGMYAGRRIFLPGLVKPHLYELSPFEKTLYLDLDTQVIHSPQPLFDLLDKWEFAIAMGSAWGGLLRDTGFSKAELAKTVELWGTGLLLYLNSGVLAWRKCDACKKLFEQWGAEYGGFGGWDEQLPLLRALYKIPVLFTTLPAAWNSRLKEGAYIYHLTGKEQIWSAQTVALCTVVIPCYDHEEFLPEAVASALQPDTTVIVVDDGSPGDVLAALQDFRDQPVYIIRQENKGLPAARNAGARASRSKVIVDLDADDRLVEGAIAKMFREWGPDLWVYTDVKLFGDMEEQIARCQVTEESLRALQPAHPAIMYSKREWGKVGGYDETLDAFTSWDFMLRMWDQGIRPRKANIVGVEYRKRRGEGMLAGILKDKEAHIAQLRARHQEFFGGQV